MSFVQAGSIDLSAKIGDFTKFGENVTVEAHSVIGSFTKIGSHSVIKENSVIGQFADISERCLVGKHISLNNYATVGAETTIGDDSTIDHYAQIGKETSIATGVRIDGYAKIGDNNQIGMGCRLAQYCITGANVEIDENAIMDQYARFDGEHIGKRGYVGQYCAIGSKVKIGELAVVHEYASLESHTIVKPTEIVIRTPTSLILYQQAANDVSTEEANIAKPSGQTISPAFNKYLLEFIEKSMQTLRACCAQSSDHKSRPQSLSKIIILYLIQYHGLERFNEYMKGLREGGESLPEAVKEMLRKECHLCGETSKIILESSVNEKFIQLLTIDQDATRQYRVEGDQFCRMLDQILNKERNIRFDGTECN